VTWSYEDETLGADGFEIDSTHSSAEQVVDRIVDLVRERKLIDQA